MDRQFHLDINRVGEEIHFNLSGPIDEEASFPSTDMTGIQSVYIDLDAITVINSVGIRLWLQWIKTFAGVRSVFIDRAHKAMVLQFNMIEGFLPSHAVVRSIYVPMYCERCDHQAEILIENIGPFIENANFTSLDVKDKLCRLKSGSSCEIDPDIVASKYLSFLRKAQLPKPG